MIERSTGCGRIRWNELSSCVLAQGTEWMATSLRLEVKAGITKSLKKHEDRRVESCIQGLERLSFLPNVHSMLVHSL